MEERRRWRRDTDRGETQIEEGGIGEKEDGAEYGC